MKQYFRYFRWIFIVLGVLAAVYFGVLALHSISGGAERKNQECLKTERVFDYGEVLTDKEEEKLEQLIAKREKQTESDIVLVTLNESLEEYAAEIEGYVSYPEFVRVYAENFYDENGFGYDLPGGDGVILVDNWFREADGSVYTWLCTTGKAKEKYSGGRIDHLLDNVYRYVEHNPYKAYKTYINEYYHDMTGGAVFTAYLAYWLPFAAAVIVMAIFVISHWVSKKGDKTVIATTYVAGGKPDIKRKEDVFINKVITQRRIERSGGGGKSGGGGGGGSHGGGGHSR